MPGYAWPYHRTLPARRCVRIPSELEHLMIDLYYWVYLDSAGVVRRAHEGVDWRNMRHTIN